MKYKSPSSLFLITLYLIISSFSSSGQKINGYLADPNAGPREHPIDLLNMDLEVSFEPVNGLVNGNVHYRFNPIRENVDSIFFDAPSITIETVMLNGKTAKFTTNDVGLTIFPDAPLHWKTEGNIDIKYHCTPRKGIYFIGWKDSTNRSRKQIWTQGQGVDNRYWIPSYDDMDDKLITSTKVTFDKDYKVLSNGTKLSEKENKDGTKTWSYTMTHPHSSYLVMLGIGKYNIDSSKSASGVPMRYWYYPDMADRVQPTYLGAEKMMDFLEKETGLKYPWESYSQIPVQDFMFGAMENTTATVYGDFLYVDARAFLDRSYMGVDAHEMTHQWFGDYVTAIDGKHNWLQESFATYYSKIFMKTIYGEDYYEWSRRGEHNGALNASKSDRNPIVHTGAGGSRTYGKGSSVLDMLRYVAGDEQFKFGINYYLIHHPYSNVETNDLYRAFIDGMGLNYDWFFDEWLYKGGEPTYDVSYDDITSASGSEYTEFKVNQIHQIDEYTGVFKMPIVFQVFYKDGTNDSKKEWIDKQSQTVRIDNPNHKKVDFVLFDPGSIILKTVNFKKSLEELKSQAMKAPNMIDRYDALVALKSFSLDDRRETLANAFKKETFQATKSEILSQLSSDLNNENTIQLYNAALKDNDAQVRFAAIQDLNDIPTSLLPNAEALLRDSSYNVVETTLEKLCSKYPDNTSKYLNFTSDVYGMGNSVKIKWLELKCVNNAMADDSSHLKLVDYTSNAFEFRTRVNAMNALQRLFYIDEKLVRNLFDAALNPNTRLTNPAMSVLDYYYKTNWMKTVIQKVYRDGHYTGWQKGILDKYGK